MYNGLPIDVEKVTVVKDGEVDGRAFGSIADITAALGKTVEWDRTTQTININGEEYSNFKSLFSIGK